MTTGRATRLTEVNPELKTMALGELKPISWRSFDGREIWGLLLTPPGYRAGSRVPLLVYCHGGPIGGFTLGIFPQFMHIPGQVDPYPTRGHGQRRHGGPLPDAARRLGIRHAEFPRDLQQLGRGRLQGHHGRRR